MSRIRRLGRWVALALAVSAVAARGAHSQGSCNVNNRATCEVGGTATFGITITILSAVSVSIPSGSVVLGAATAADFTAGFGAPLTVPVTVRANQNWSLSLAASSPLWIGSPLTARQDKPAADLQWSVAAAGPYTDLGLIPQTVSSGMPSAGTIVPLLLRARYVWTVDSPGSYSLPLQLTIAAP